MEDESTKRAEESPQAKRANEVLKLLGESRSLATLCLLYEYKGADCIPSLTLGDRKLEFVGDNPKGLTGEGLSGHIMYGDDNWDVHCYGSFAPSEDQIQRAAGYLLNPDTPPPSIRESVDRIVEGLVEQGIKRKEIAVDWSKRPDQPVIYRSGLDDVRVEFGLFSPGTISIFTNPGPHSSLGDESDAIKALKEGI